MRKVTPNTELEVQLDLLVDDELPDPNRVQILRQLDTVPTGWRMLALRFLERQVEHKVFHNYTAVSTPAPVYPVVPTAPLSFPTPQRHYFRYAAGLGIILLLGVGLWLNLKQTQTINPLDQAALSTVNIILPGSLNGGTATIKVPVQGRSTIAQITANEAPGDNQQLLIVADDNDHIIALPVVALGQTIY